MTQRLWPKAAAFPPRGRRGWSSLHEFEKEEAAVAGSPNAAVKRGQATSADLADLDVAVVHDYLNQRGGAERVALELSDMWPKAPIYTSLYRPNSTLPQFRGRDIRTTPLQRLPVDKGFRALFPLYPAAFRSFGLIDADVVVSSTSGWAHMVRPHERAVHIIYCHNPARWLYGGAHLSHGSRSSRAQMLARPTFEMVRRIDRAAAREADVYVANSEVVRERIRRTYGIEAHVIPPPVDVDRFRPTPRGERLLMVSRLLPYKNIEPVVDAATQMGIGLDVVGDGPLLPVLRAKAGPTVTLHGPVRDSDVVELMEGCRAVCVAAEEDFGMVSVEAQAAGKPVIALGRGGSLETVDPGYSGVFFGDHSVESIRAAIEACESIDTAPELIAQRARRFSRAAFRARLGGLMANALEQRRALSLTEGSLHSDEWEGSQSCRGGGTGLAMRGEL